MADRRVGPLVVAAIARAAGIDRPIRPRSLGHDGETAALDAGHPIRDAQKFIAATGHDSFSEGSSSVRNLGLGQQIETRLRQDKGLDATGIVVDVEEDGTAVLRGLVSSSAHKDKAVALVRDTRGVERVVDHLAVPPTARVIDTFAGGSVPTGDATHSSTLK